MDPKSRSFLGAIAASIHAFCMLFIKSVRVADDAVSMADKAVKTAKKRQFVSLDLEMADYVTKTVNAAMLKQVQEEEAIRDYVSGNPEREALMNKARENLTRIVNNSLAQLAAEEQ